MLRQSLPALIATAAMATTAFAGGPILNVDTAESFATIQAAHDDTNTLDGHTLEVTVAAHAEGPQIVFTKDLTLRGVAGTRPLITATGNTGTGGDSRGWFLVETGVILDVENLDFDGDGFLIYQGFRNKGGGSFTDCGFNDIRRQVSGSPYIGNAITAFGTDPVDVSRCTFSLIGRHGVFYFGSGVNGSLCDSIVYTGKGDGDHLDYAVELGAGAQATVRNSIMTDCRGVASSDGSSSAGILATTFFGPGTALTAEGNKLLDNTTGIYIGFNGSDTTVASAHYNTFVGNSSRGITSVGSVIADGTENWWGDASGPLDATGTFEADNPPCFPPDPDELFDVVNADGLGDPVDPDGTVDYCPWLTSQPMLALVADDSCYQTGETVAVSIDMSGQSDLIVGGQFFLEYDNTVLDFTGAAPGDSPFTVEIYEIADEVAGTIDYAVGVSGGGPGTSADSTMAVVSFTAIAEVCGADSLVSFRSHEPPTRITNDMGASILPMLMDLDTIIVDGTDPMITCPADITVDADAGFCSAIVMPGTATATDSCDPAPMVEGERDDLAALGDPYPAGTTTITWTATDACGNTDVCEQMITVNGVTDLLVTVELQPVVDSGPFDRCITFELFDCPGASPTIVEAVMTFSGGVASDTIEVPCGSYSCITARDRLHTLRRTDDDDFGVAGTQYTADFTNSGGDDDSLIGGNHNDDQYIDILDFGVHVGQFGAMYGTGDTTCATPFPHGDTTGDGMVDVGDFSFIQVNFLEVRDPNCCGLSNLVAAGAGWLGESAPHRGVNTLSSRNGGPITRISLRELHRGGLGDLAVADLNRDGWLDELDVAAFIEGARP